MPLGVVCALRKGALTNKIAKRENKSLLVCASEKAFDFREPTVFRVNISVETTPLSVIRDRYITVSMNMDTLVFC